MGKKRSPLKVRAHDLLSYKKFLLERGNLKSATINLKLSALKSFFRFLSINYNRRDISRGVKLLKFIPAEKVTPTECEVEKLLNSVDTSTVRGKRDYLVLLLLSILGLRRSSLLELKIGDFKRENRNYWIRVKGKGAKARILKIPNGRLERALKSYKDIDNRDKSEYLITTSKSKPLFKNSLNRIVEKHSRNAGIYRKGLSPHSLRHFAISNILANANGRISLAELQEFSGHHSLSSLQGYIRHNLKKNAVDFNSIARGKRIAMGDD